MPQLLSFYRLSVTRIVSVVLLFVLIALAQPVAASVTGLVTDSLTSNTVSGAWVYFSATDSAQTDTNGSYSFPNLGGGTYSCLIRKIGYVNYRQSVTLVTGTNTVSFTLAPLTAPLNPVGWWNFDNTANLTQAMTGRDFTLVGTNQAIAGPATGNGAVNIGVGSYYRCFHDIPANGGGTWVNEYSIVIDFRVPSVGQWYTFFQTNYANTNDGEAFVNPNGTIGVAATGYSSYAISPNEWYRLIISADLGTSYKYYLDGQLLQDGGVQTVDGRFAIYPYANQNQVLFFADENQEDNPIDVAQVMFYNRPLNATEAIAIGGFGHTVVNPALIMTPYLQTPTPNAISIGWHSSVSNNTIVEYGTTAALGQSATGSAQTIGSMLWHNVRLTGLTPNTTYYYRCRTDTATTAVTTFRTPPPNGSRDGHLRFMLTSDSQSNIAQSTRGANAMRETLLQLYGANYADSVSLVMHSGDIVGNGLSYGTFQTEYFVPFRQLNQSIPFMVSIGNHETESPAYYNYMEYDPFAGYEGERYYSFQLGRVLFIALNSNTQGNTQLTWLTNRLATAQADTSIDMIFVSTHHPGHSEIWPDGNTNWTLNSVIPLLENTPKAMMISNGHSHNYERGLRDAGNLRTLLCGGAGGALDRWRMYTNQTDYPEIQRSLDYYNYVLVDVDLANNSYQATTYSLGNSNVPLNNVVVDRWHFSRNGTPPATPQAIAPSGGFGGAVTLMASAFSGSDSIQCSQFQLTSIMGNYSTPLVNSLRHYENIYNDTGAPEYQPIDRNAGIDLSQLARVDSLLTPNTTYWWRVRYRDRNLKWSEWSEEQSFNWFGAGTEEETLAVPQEWLAQNYPNPFNATTTISYSIKQPGTVHFAVYDMNGRMVEQRSERKAVAGLHTFAFDGHKLASGVYHYQIECNGFTATRRMIFVK
ncbi:MAG: fibronectin type III domain-containing protein [bacterium]|nr:fibronectin type III domain-containing protein [bacterium]